MTSNEHVKEQTRRWIGHALWAVVAVAAFAIGALTSGAEPTSDAEQSSVPVVPPNTKVIELAVDECAATVHVEVLDDGDALSIDGAGEEVPGATIDEITCILTALDVPDAVISRMSRTRALDGTQDATWGDLAASWTYHPDDGLDVIVEVSQ